MIYQLGIIGGGAIGEALVAGAVKSGQYAPSQIIISDPLETRLNYLHEQYQIQITKNNEQVISQATVIVMATKPQVFIEALNPLAGNITSGQLLISVAAGITLAEIEGLLTAKVPVVRVMPNTPCLIGKGATVLSRGSYAMTEHLLVAEDLFRALGLTLELPERDLNGVTALSGSGPAYVYLVLEALIDAGVRVGLPRDLSRQLILQTMAGAVQMVVETGKHPAELRDMVTSPAGTTAAALEHLETEGLRGTLIKAVVKAWERGEELSRAKE